MKPNTPMKRLFAVLAACAAFCCALEAQTPQPLYPDGPERSSGIDPASTVDRDGVLFNVTVPDYYVFLPERERAVGQMVVVCPGGGYGCVCYEREGLEVARWLGDHGIAALVLRYRMPNGHHEIPLEDVHEAIRIARLPMPRRGASIRIRWASWVSRPADIWPRRRPRISTNGRAPTFRF